jgi:hypothetical protein
LCGVILLFWIGVFFLGQTHARATAHALDRWLDRRDPE